MRPWGVGLVMLMAVSAAEAQTPSRDPEADFLFGQPRGWIGVRGGWQIARAGSDLFAFFSDLLTVEGSDFDSALIGVDGGYSIHDRLDVVVGFEFTSAGANSEYRDFEEDNGLPIVQETRLRIVPLTGGVKLYLLPRGRQVSRFAYVPAKLRPYVGGGGGLIWYELLQSGDFVDFVDLSIFTATLRSTGWGTMLQAFGGMDVGLGSRLFLSFEGRYEWADAGLSGDFLRFEPVDLSGLRITGGLNVMF